MDGDLSSNHSAATAPTPLIDLQALASAATAYAAAKPFPHLVIDDFLPLALADALEAEFPPYESEAWHEYNNAIEVKRTCNNWNHFPPTTYAFFGQLNSAPFVEALSALLGLRPLYPDPGLNGGGWHIHGPGGKLNPHLDYSIHPKVGLQRKLNLIIYLNRDWNDAWGGGLGLWEHDPLTGGPGALAREIAPRFNRAVLFDTTQNSWHGLPGALACPPGRLRKSLAVYYLTDPPAGVDPRGKALFAPTEDQKGDPDVLDLIRRRADVGTAGGAYRE
jgi:2-oxoglutarate-Fe(II)-dependent oxygenase superfamily protein